MLSHFQNRPDSLDESGEEQPLLLASNDYKSRSRRYFDTPLVVKEIYFILGYSWPLLVTYLVGTANKLVDAWFLGRLGAHVMAVVSLGQLWSTVGGVAIGSGLLSAIDTLVAQAFTAAHNSTTLGIILQRGLAIMAIFAGGVVTLWMFANPILVAMGQAPDLAQDMQLYLYIILPTVYPVFVSTAVRKFMQALGEMRVTMYMMMPLFPISCLTAFVFLDRLNLGFVGAACHFLTYHSLILVVYITFLCYGTQFRKKYWPGWSKQAFRQWREFLRLGIPGMLSGASDWAFEVCALLSGTLAKTSLAGQSIILSVNSFLLMIPLALSNAASVRIGHLLGSHRPDKIKTCIHATCILGVAIVTFNATLMFALRWTIATHFSQEMDVIQAAIDLMPIACISHFSAGLGSIFSGALNAFGKQSIVCSVNLVSYYMIGVPLGLYLGRTMGFGLNGIWAGFAVAAILKATWEVAILASMDWELECRRTSRRISEQELP